MMINMGVYNLTDKAITNILSQLKNTYFYTYEKLNIPNHKYANVQYDTHDEYIQTLLKADIKGIILFIEDKKEQWLLVKKYYNQTQLYIVLNGVPLPNKNVLEILDTLDNKVINTPNGATLRPYQVTLVDFILDKKRCGLFVDMGLGKTLSTLASIQELVNTKSINPEKPILIVAPIMVALDTWAREAEKWGYDFDVEINIKLNKKKRNELFNRISKPLKKPTIVTTNPEQLKHIVEYSELIGKNLFDMIIIDELSMFKSPTSNRFNFIKDLDKGVKYFIGLTGTPAPNNLLDVWSQLIIIDNKNKSLFGNNFYKYRDYFFVPEVEGPNGIVYKWGLKRGAEDEIYKRMKPTVLSMKSEGLVSLPEITYSNVYVKLPPKIMKYYNELDKEIRNALNQSDDNQGISVSDDLTVSNTAVLSSKLLQLASGSVYQDDGDYIVYHDVKYQMLKSIVETATSPILLFYYFQSQLQQLGEYVEYTLLDPKADNVKEIISKWNKGEIPLLVGHPASIGHGLNLQDGGHTIIWLGPIPTTSNEQYRQANKRLYRSGQKHPVSVIHIVAEGTEDEKVLKALDKKEEGQEKLMDALEYRNQK